MTEADNAITHRRGFALTLFGVLVLTPDTLLMRLIDTDPWTMTFSRGLLMGIALMVVFFAARGRYAVREIKALGMVGLVVAIIYAVNAVSFVIAIENTKVANVLVILAAGPLFAGLLSVLFLRERVAGPTWAAIAAGIVGVAIVVSGGIQAGTALGDFCAVITALSLAVGFTVIRRVKVHNMIPATALGGLISAMLAAPFAQPLIGAGSPEGTQFILILIMGLIVLPVSFGLITLGPRTVPAPEVALLMLVETVLGPFWVWWVIDERPDAQTFIGGAVVLGAITLHAFWRLSRRRVVA
tara:strand:- start:561 stop:1454 length:894 start_codon:yes stop_codon:yes gene_type:complete